MCHDPRAGNLPQGVQTAVGAAEPVNRDARNPSLRASDDDRQRVIAELERHTAAGRLTLDEFGERVNLVLHATTHRDLGVLIDDLGPDPGLAAQAEAERHAHGRQLAIAFAIAVATLALLAIVLTLGR
jgi:hypothetical protein